MQLQNQTIPSLVLSVALTAWMHNVQAQSPAPMPRDELGRLVLPDPTPEQREQGKQLLEKILSVMRTIPLTDGEKVLNGLGFQKFRRYAGPEYESIATTDGEAGTSEDQGFSHIEITKFTVLPTPLKWSPFMLSGYLAYERGYAGPCIHVEDAMTRLRPLARTVSFSPTISTEPCPYSPRQEVDRAGFSGFTHPQGRIDVISLTYEKQFCAFAITVHYMPASGGTQP